MCQCYWLKLVKNSSLYANCRHSANYRSMTIMGLNIHVWKLYCLYSLKKLSILTVVRPQLEYCIPETGHIKTEVFAKKSNKNDSGLQEFELRGKVEKVWTNNTVGERHVSWRWCLRKNTRRKATGNHLPTFPKNMASQIRNNANDVNGIFSSAGYVTSGNGGDEASGVVIQRNPHIKIGT